MISLPRTFSSRDVQLTRAVISEVGDGKNLVDTDFQQVCCQSCTPATQLCTTPTSHPLPTVPQVQMSLTQRINSGADVETAQQILDNLNANPTAGSANAAIDLAGRQDEPAKAAAAKPYAGIDLLYDRLYEYDESGVWTGVRLRQFFGLGDGLRVSASELRSLWKQGEPQLALQPVRLEPGGGERGVRAKPKPSKEAEEAVRLQKRMRRNVLDLQRWRAKIKAAEAAAKAAAEATTFRCRLGCRVQPTGWLTAAGRDNHEQKHCAYRQSVQPTQSVQDCRIQVYAPHQGTRSPTRSRRHGAHLLFSQVKVRLARPGLVARLDLRVNSLGVVTAQARPHASCPVRASLVVRRPLAPPRPYGLQPFAVAPAPPSLSPAEMHAACDVQVAGLRALLVVEPAMRHCGPTHVRLQLSTPRQTPQLLASGWAQRPPVVRTVFTSEQRALLIELFERRDRPNESQMFEIVNERFSYASGMYDMRLTRTQIKSFMSTEKARRKKAAAAGVVAAAVGDGTLQAEDGDEGDDEGEGAEEDAVRRETALGGAQQAPGAAAAAKVRCPTVEEMRKEAAALGWGAEASPAFAKGKKAVLAVLQRAQAAPRPVVAQAVQSGPEGSSGEEGGEEDEDEGEGEQVPAGSDVYVVDALRAKRRRGGVTEYFVHWKGWSAKWDTWEPGAHLPRSCICEFEDERGPEEETDDDTTPLADKSDEEEEEPQPPCPFSTPYPCYSPSALLKPLILSHTPLPCHTPLPARRAGAPSTRTRRLRASVVCCCWLVFKGQRARAKACCRCHGGQQR